MSAVAQFLGLVLLLSVANGAPVLSHFLLGDFANWPIDGGRRGRDGFRLLGSSKTWRGLLAAVLASAFIAALLGLGFWFGAAFGASAMLGDLFSSYIKRRRGLASSARATGLDQFPEALAPLLLSHWWLGIGWGMVILASLGFFLVVTRLSPLLFRMGIRRRPH